MQSAYLFGLGHGAGGGDVGAAALARHTEGGCRGGWTGNACLGMRTH